MPVNRRQIENAPLEEIEVQPSAAMLDDIVNFYHATMKDEGLAIEQRIKAAQELVQLGRHGFNVDPIFATTSFYKSSS